MRKTYLDNIKWITVVLVVVYHVIYIFNGVQPNGVIGPFTDPQYQDLFQYIVYPWFMLLLFVVSGMGARFALNTQTDREFIRTRTVKFLVPSTLGLLVFGWVLGYYNMQIAGAFEQMGAVPKPVLYLIMSVSGCGVLWYIQLLWVFSVLLILIRKVEKDRLYRMCEKTSVPVVISFVILVWAAAQVLNTPVIVVYRFGIYGLGFLLGYFVFSHDEVMNRLSRQWILLTVLGIVSGCAFTIRYWGQNYADHAVLDTLMCNVFAWFGTLAVLAFMKRWGDFENAFTGFMYRKSWGLYLFHYLPLAACSYYLTGYIPGMPAVIYYLAAAVSAFAGAYILYELLSRIPLIRWLVCGISRKKRD